MRLSLLFAAVLLAWIPSHAAQANPSTLPHVVVVDGNVAYFATGNAICRTDGTSDGTRCFPTGGIYWRELLTLNGTAYFRANGRVFAFDGTSEPRQIFELRSDGIPQNGPGSNGTHLFYFTGPDRVPTGVHLKRTDTNGGDESTVKTLLTTEASSAGRAGNSMLMRVLHTSEWSVRDEWDLWSTDGTREGTKFLTSEYFYPLTHLGPIALFRKSNSLWRTDGTPAGTFVLSDDVNPWQLSIDGNLAYFTYDRQVWRTDGTTAIPLRRLEFEPKLTGATNARLCFLEIQPGEATVWGALMTDGAPFVLAKIPSLSMRAITSNTIQAAGLAFFLIARDKHAELWRTDGTPRGTFSVATLAEAYPSGYASMGDKFLFFASDGVHGIEPWISDGTVAGTHMIANLAPEGTVRGIVTDTANGMPIENATVEASPGPSVHTNAEGRFTLEGLLGPVTVAAYTDIHLPAITSVTVRPNEELEVDFALVAGSRLAGRVINSSGQALANIHLDVAFESGASAVLTTDANGRYTTPVLPAGAAWSVRAGAQAGHNAASQTGAALHAGETRDVPDLVMTPFGRIRVRIIDAATRGALRSFMPSMLAYKTGTNVFVNRAGADGDIVELPLPDDEYDLATQGYGSYWDRWYEGAECTQRNGDCTPTPFHLRGTRIRCSSGTTTEIVIALRPLGSSIRGVLVDAVTGAHLSGGTVMVRTVDDVTAAVAYVAKDGSFETEPRLFDDSYTVTVTPPFMSQYLPQTLQTEVQYAKNPRHEIEFRLERGATLHGHIVDENGNAISDARVLAGGQSRRTDTRGWYSFSALPPGGYSVVATRNGYDDAQADNVVLERGRKTTVDLTMRRKQP